MSKEPAHLHTGAAALGRMSVGPAVAVRLALPVLISILISHAHADPV